MRESSRLCSLAIAAAALVGMCLPQNIHILLRSKDGRTSFHLGEPIALEAACIGSATGQYLSPCVVVLKAEPSSPDARLSADRIDQTTWQDAQSGELTPGPRSGCGNIDNQLPSQASNAPTWKSVTLEEPFPRSPGEYKLKAELAYDLEISQRLVEPQSHSSSDEVKIGIDDNLSWKKRLMNFSNCDYDVRLTLVRDSDAAEALRKHLGECALEDDESLAMLLHEIVWLKMQVDQPELYARMVELEQTYLVPRGNNEADLQQQLDQARLSAISETTQIGQWFRDQY